MSKKSSKKSLKVFRIILLIVILFIIGSSLLCFFRNRTSDINIQIQDPNESIDKVIQDITEQNSNVVDKKKDAECQKELKNLELWEYFWAFYSPIEEACMVFWQEITDWTMNLNEVFTGYGKDEFIDLKHREFIIRYLDDYKLEYRWYFSWAHYEMYQMYNLNDYNDYSKWWTIQTFCSKWSEFNPDVGSRSLSYSCKEDRLQLRMLRLAEVEKLKGNNIN